MKINIDHFRLSLHRWFRGDRASPARTGAAQRGRGSKKTKQKKNPSARYKVISLIFLRGTCSAATSNKTKPKNLKRQF